jgi:hypothetical protein
LVGVGAEFTREGGAAAPKVSNPSLGHLASYARIAIHLGEISFTFWIMDRRSRNKIAQNSQAGLRLLPVLSAAFAQPRTLNPRAEES